MKTVRVAAIASLVMALLPGCSKKEEPVTMVAPVPVASSPATPLMPDVGKVDTVFVRADGIGASPSVATAEAMKSALLQVNGTTIDMSSVGVKYGLDITDGKDVVSLRASEFAEAVAQKSGGAITNFKMVNLTEPSKPSEPYKVTIEANIAHFTAPTDSKKIKVVIGPVLYDASTFTIGSDVIPAAKVAEDIHGS